MQAPVTVMRQPDPPPSACPLQDSPNCRAWGQQAVTSPSTRLQDMCQWHPTPLHHPLHGLHPSSPMTPGKMLHHLDERDCNGLLLLRGVHACMSNYIYSPCSRLEYSMLVIAWLQLGLKLFHTRQLKNDQSSSRRSVQQMYACRASRFRPTMAAVRKAKYRFSTLRSRVMHRSASGSQMGDMPTRNASSSLSVQLSGQFFTPLPLLHILLAFQAWHW